LYLFHIKKLDELGKLLVNLSMIVPSGMVVFFVSYDYLDKAMNHFKKNNVLEILGDKKTVRTILYKKEIIILEFKKIKKIEDIFRAKAIKRM
jgi:Rad3-related DNA helicase